uniref:Uncharacterized protein n=1 Tax=Oryza meridionalis TaxID=40149 RepID=A0A0E0E7K9_9ORYZ
MRRAVIQGLKEKYAEAWIATKSRQSCSPMLEANFVEALISMCSQKLTRLSPPLSLNTTQTSTDSIRVCIIGCNLDNDDGGTGNMTRFLNLDGPVPWDNWNLCSWATGERKIRHMQLYIHCETKTKQRLQQFKIAAACSDFELSQPQRLWQPYVAAKQGLVMSNVLETGNLRINFMHTMFVTKKNVFIIMTALMPAEGEAGPVFTFNG